MYVLSNIYLEMWFGMRLPCESEWYEILVGSNKTLSRSVMFGRWSVHAAWCLHHTVFCDVYTIWQVLYFLFSRQRDTKKCSEIFSTCSLVKILIKWSFPATIGLTLCSRFATKMARFVRWRKRMLNCFSPKHENQLGCKNCFVTWRHSKSLSLVKDKKFERKLLAVRYNCRQ